MNKYIVRENSSGKTRELLEFAKENNFIVICRDAVAMERKAQAYGIYGLNFLSYLFGNECCGFTQTIE